MHHNFLKEKLSEFSAFSDTELHEITSRFKVENYLKGQFIFEHNELISNVYLIQSGLVRLSYWSEDGKEHILSFAMEGWWETDFSAFYLGEQSRFTLYCMEDTQTSTLSLAEYQKLINKFPSLSRYFVNKSMRGHIANQRRIITLLSLNPTERYEAFLATYPALSQRISKTILASYLGVSRETLSRLSMT